MNIDALYLRLVKVIKEEYPDVALSIDLRDDRLRVYLVDNSFLDIWFSRRIPGKYSFHWERRNVNGTVYRWDNAAHRSVTGINTFPHHFHESSQLNVKPFKPESEWEDTLRDILNFIRDKIKHY
ncbi:toxin-antitoxin system TumE family protein [Candidatus Korarchaeum cryptofilum]|uniref:Uncharacterized protein n=1 Tax=Korarchaeum cryptofilum (strain OPF8) TaxID=374847 RepID=B1L4R2_KORCO|nr:DUF6516 family protein [Candidatus Korarchaeum cryptofilum]ACB07441.1 hypothetical protein Kcr_0690 [Candidatus Korarchaeum cryptofilum OPF8]